MPANTTTKYSAKTCRQGISSIRQVIAW